MHSDHLPVLRPSICYIVLLQPSQRVWWPEVAGVVRRHGALLLRICVAPWHPCDAQPSAEVDYGVVLYAVACGQPMHREAAPWVRPERECLTPSPRPSMLHMQALARMMRPFVDWAATRYQANLGNRLRSYGLRYDDLYDPMMDLVRELQRALRRATAAISNDNAIAQGCVGPHASQCHTFSLTPC
jgi:Ubiquinol-cytochrome C reductase complex 14kD subunit